LNLRASGRRYGWRYDFAKGQKIAG